MFEAQLLAENEIALSGRLDASQIEKAKSVLDQIKTSAIVNCKDLEYISSAGLGVLLMTQKRLVQSGSALKIANLNSHIKDVFKYSGFDKIFEIS
jgi:anti-sigma B factor antagonist